MQTWGYKKEWLEFRGEGKGKVLVCPSEISAMREIWPVGCKLLTRLFLRASETIDVAHSLDEVLKIIEDSRETVEVGPPPPDKATRERLRQEELKRVEEMGEASMRGAQKALKKDDRESWGKPGE